MLRDPDLPETWAEWRNTGRVPEAPISTLRLICTLQANVAEAEALLPQGNRAHQEKLLSFAQALMAIRSSVGKMIGREFPFPRDGGGLTTWPWEAGWEA